MSDEVIISAIFSLGIGIILGYFFHQKGKEKKVPQCCYITYRQIQKLSPHDRSPIKILYNEQEVEQVYTTYVWFWNSGKKAIKREDLRTQSRLNLSIGNNQDKNSDFKVLDYKVIKTTKPEIQFATSLTTDRSLAIEFDFLNRNDGALIEIQHNGYYNTRIIIDGAIIEGPDRVKTKVLNRIPIRKGSTLQRISGITVHTLLLALGLYLLAGISIAQTLLYTPTQIISSLTQSDQLLIQNIRDQFPNATDQQAKEIVRNYQDDTFRYARIGFAICGILALYMAIESIAKKISQREPYPKILSLSENNDLPRSKRTNEQLEPVDELKRQVVTNERERVVFEQTQVVGMSLSDIHKYRGDLFKSEEEVRHIYQDLMNRIHQSISLRSSLRLIQDYYYPPGYEQQSNESRPDIHENQDNAGHPR